MCGWCKDRWRHVWQTNQHVFPGLTIDPNGNAAKQIFDSMKTMTKIDIAALERADKRRAVE
ncbi:MAG: hypothetical protein R8G34_13745 [Paracoccaceae bacterium]|nr:hypothetical protein [Paracoccaceae bacterium]